MIKDRSCVNCSSQNSEVMFTFTRDFFHNVRNQPLEQLDALGIDDNFTSSIVKCIDCGCGYIKDVINIRETFLGRENWSSAQIKENLRTYQNGFSKSGADNIIYAESVVKNLIRLVMMKNKNKSELSLLDFGCSFSVYSPLARIMGFTKVDAFDPHFPDNSSELASGNSVVNFNFFNHKEQILENAPYDAIICNSADEHFLDPQGEINFMSEVLSDDGVIYFSHPIMDLDSNLKHLQNESNITNKKLIKELRATFHVHHLNYIMPKIFKKMLKKGGLVESKVVILKKENLSESAFHVKNLILYTKTFIKYFLGLFGSNYRKTEYFLTKIK